jgi:hypothetical protein
MSDYKIVDGKKVRVCKYNCGTELVWSDEISGFIETKGGVAHTQNRCKEVKSKQEITLESVLAKLENMVLL